MSIDLEALGITKEELQARVIERAVQRIFETTSLDEDGDEFVESSAFAGRLEKAVKAAIDNKVADLAEKHVLPLTASVIENLTLQQTNRWGEKTGAPVTFIEYLIQRAEHYLREDVNYEGKSKDEAGSYSWNKSQTRLTYLVNQHLHYSIDTAMKQAIANANAVIVGGIQETVKIKLGEIAQQLKVEVKTR
jgi:hypothetical protein